MYTINEVGSAMVFMGIVLGFAIYGVLTFIDKSMDGILERIFDYRLEKYRIKHQPVDDHSPLVDYDEIKWVERKGDSAK